VIAVVGATGRQGGAVLRALLDQGVAVRALTRTPDSPGARALRDRGAEVVTADLESVPSLIRAFDGTRGVFGVTEFWEHGFAGEVRHGTHLVAAARAARVRQLVFGSVGGTESTAGLGITHIDSKAEIEKRIRQSDLDWTVVRPVTFFENFVSARYRRAIRRGVFRFGIRPGLPFQFVAIGDLAALVARAFREPERFRHRAIEVASDQLTMEAFSDALASAVGRPVRYGFIPPFAQRAVGAFVELTRTTGHFKVGGSLVAQFAWNNASPHGGWAADLASLAELIPLTKAGAWARSVDWRR
jgi:uncharacterized protein YbjT (DUF2867 family)